MIPALLIYLHNVDNMKIEQILTKSEEELKLKVNAKSLLESLTNAFILFKLYVILDLVKLINNGVALPMMEESATNMDMEAKFQKLFGKLDKLIRKPKKNYIMNKMKNQVVEGFHKVCEKFRFSKIVFQPYITILLG